MIERGEAARGVIAASAGNHAQALAYHGQELGVPVTVVMPRWASLVKVSNCRSFGANILLHGEAYEDAKKEALRLSEEKKLTYVPGFDDEDIIAGQGTLGLEILEDVPDVEAIVVPVGGGGLIAGIATAVKAVRPEVKIVGVEPINAPTLQESLKAGKVVKVETKPTLADGLAIAEVGKICFDLIRERLDDLLLVDEPTIARSVLKLLELEKTMVEGAGAVPLAAAMTPSCNLRGKKVVLVLAGGNIDVTLLSRIIDRGLAAEGRLCRVTVCVGDRPGSLARLTNILAGTGANVVEIEHDRHFGPADPALVTISATCETRDFDHIGEIERALTAAGLEFTRAT
jgi:threonine dehydratase